ncbi:S1 family peptidase [Streptomyces sp. Marseille-Q5077]|uniref:S1 family peptidase n=1 Tax=Streptomyces sp. Marseille-Q5077 TaxID=3418995 RepID=UPI003D018368
MRIREGGTPLGAGFLVTRVYVLTAMHCLRSMSSEDASLELELPDGRILKGRLCDSVQEVDLALISVEGARVHQLPPAPPTDWPRPQVRWRGSYCPPGEHMQLSGIVTHAPITYRSAEQGEFMGLQLTAEQNVDDFSGYSGSPVDTDPRKANGQRPVVGILMEQLTSRENPAQGSNVLIAASIRHALDLFPHFGVDHLRQGGHIPPPRTAGRNMRRGTEDVLTSLRQWEEAGLITADEAQEQRRRTLRQFGNTALGGDPDEC